MDDGFGLGWEVRLFNGERVEGSSCGASVEGIDAEECAEAECTETEAVLGEEMPSGDGGSVQMGEEFELFVGWDVEAVGFHNLYRWFRFRFDRLNLSR